MTSALHFRSEWIVAKMPSVQFGKLPREPGAAQYRTGLVERAVPEESPEPVFGAAKIQINILILPLHHLQPPSHICVHSG